LKKKEEKSETYVVMSEFSFTVTKSPHVGARQSKWHENIMTMAILAPANQSGTSTL